jgi:hypothetical protein
MTKNQTPEYFASKVANASSDTAAMRWMMKAEAALTADQFAQFLLLVKGL